ncbi:MAG: NUDIX hydrolase [Clostridia bacterium]|nr:NUDIX hydrolase [Clostridia bacterium]
MDGENKIVTPAEQPIDKTEVTLSSECVYDAGFIKVMSDRVRLPNGRETGRTYVKHPGGVCVCAVDAEGNVAFVRQYRYAMAEEVLELPAGKIDEGESPEDCGRRELMEETGMTAEKFIPLGIMYPTPGYSNEGIYMFLAENAIRGAAKPDEDEFLDTLYMPFDKALYQSLTGAINDAKTVICMARADLRRRRGK